MAEKSDYLNALDAAVRYFASGEWIATLPDLKRITIDGKPHSIRQVCGLVDAFDDRLPGEVYRVIRNQKSPRLGRAPTEAREGRIVRRGRKVPAGTDRAAHPCDQGVTALALASKRKPRRSGAQVEGVCANEQTHPRPDTFAWSRGEMGRTPTPHLIKFRLCSRSAVHPTPWR
jgi:hypothetical protein